MPQEPASSGSPRPFPAGLLVVFIAAATLFVVGIATWKAGPSGLGPNPDSLRPAARPEGLERAGNADALRAWLTASDEMRDQYYGGFGDVAVRAVAAESAPTMGVDGDMAVGAPSDGEQGATRVGGTNVQVFGIDEPDILKTDGRRLFFSPQTYYGWPWMVEPMFRGVPVDSMMLEIEAREGEASSGSSGSTTPASPPSDTKIDVVEPDGAPDRMIAPAPDFKVPTLKVIDAFPPEDLALLSEIEHTGEMLLHEDVLSVFTYDGIHAYDVHEDAAVATWSYDYGDDHQLVTARLRGGEIFLVLRAGIDRGSPCPIMPLASTTTNITVPCGDVWHPRAPVPSDVTYSVVALDARTGAQRGAVAFMGSWNSSAIYMSADDVYATWVLPGDTLGMIVTFIGENADLFPSDVRAKIANLSTIDISDRARMVELQVILEEWMSAMDNDAIRRLENEFTDRAATFMKAHMREFQRTGIVRISAADLSVAADGTVPGVLLNQFSLDAYEGHLRVATTAGGRGFGWELGFGGGAESANDVYVLDAALDVVGSVTDLGLGERIYSARFVGDEGYVVTFRETDPFYVIDLSDPRAPRMAGELKIPGFSSYLHPVTDDLILGVGREEGQVKLSLFDVADPSAPKETAKYLLDEYWSDVLNTHHAFLLDAEHEVFFMPGGQGGYVFSYGPASLELVRAVTDVRASRAVYLDDYLYIVGDDAVVVLDENDWSRVNELDLLEE